MNARNMIAEDGEKRKKALAKAAGTPAAGTPAAKTKTAVLPNPPLVPDIVPVKPSTIPGEPPITAPITGPIEMIKDVAPGTIPEKKKTIYDIQREKISAEAEREKQRRIEALKRKMAAQGQSGSGIEEKALRALEQDIERGKGAAMQSVEGAEAQSEEEAAQREEARLFEESMLGKKTEAEKELIGTKTGAEKELIGTKTEAEKELLNQKTLSEKDILTLQGAMEKDITTFKNELQKQNEMRKLNLDRFYNLGFTKTQPNLTTWNSWTKEEQDAFKAGQTGLTKQEFDDRLKAKEDYRLALITSLDPDDKAFGSKLQSILKELGYIVW